MKLGNIIGGLVCGALGGALAFVAPDYIAKDAKDFADSSNAVYDAAAAKDAKVGGQFLFSGVISEDNKTGEKDIVVGAKMVSTERKRTAAQRRKDKAKKNRKRKKDIDTTAYKPLLKVDIEGVGTGVFVLDTHEVENPTVQKRDEAGKTDTSWTGLKKGDKVSIRGSITKVDPLSVEVTKGQVVIGGDATAVLASDAGRDENVVKGVKYAGFGFLGIGGIFLLLGLFKS